VIYPFYDKIANYRTAFVVPTSQVSPETGKQSVADMLAVLAIPGQLVSQHSVSKSGSRNVGAGNQNSRDEGEPRFKKNRGHHVGKDLATIDRFPVNLQVKI
jgi:hypothetical protein